MSPQNFLLALCVLTVAILTAGGMALAWSHRAADGTTVTGRPAQDGRPAHGIACSSPVGRLSKPTKCR